MVTIELEKEDRMSPCSQGSSCQFKVIGSLSIAQSSLDLCFIALIQSGTLMLSKCIFGIEVTGSRIEFQSLARLGFTLNQK